MDSMVDKKTIEKLGISVKNSGLNLTKKIYGL